MKFNITVKIVPLCQPNAEAKSFVIVFDYEQTRQLKCASWRQTTELVKPFIPEDHFVCALEKIEADYATA